ncbi:hypothetical protein SCFA_2390006 [anaerobic digester metagenome]|uniref:Uncharacterized protein n=1 Tax=anaerobic digester metagenome TaxID=1263854 RepID=A0A485M4Q9_9ZZZZ
MGGEKLEVGIYIILTSHEWESILF